MSFLRNLFGMGESKNAYDHVYGGQGGYGPDNQYYENGPPAHHHHKSSLTHEIIAGAAGFAAMKAYEDHCRRTGERVSHPFMKEMLAGVAAAEVDKLFETRGLDFLDREKAKRHAVEQAHHIANERYGPGGTFNYDQNQYEGGSGYYPQQGGGSGYYPQQGGQDYYPPQGGPGYYPPQGGPGFYPPQGGQGFYPPQGGQGYYSPQGGPGYYPQQGGSGY